MKAKTFDRKFDAAEKIVDHLDLSKARRIGTDPKPPVAGGRYPEASHNRQPIARTAIRRGCLAVVRELTVLGRRIEL